VIGVIVFGFVPAPVFGDRIGHRQSHSRAQAPVVRRAIEKTPLEIGAVDIGAKGLALLVIGPVRIIVRIGFIAGRKVKIVGILIHELGGVVDMAVDEIDAKAHEKIGTDFNGAREGELVAAALIEDGIGLIERVDRQGPDIDHIVIIAPLVIADTEYEAAARRRHRKNQADGVETGKAVGRFRTGAKEKRIGLDAVLRKTDIEFAPLHLSESGRVPVHGGIIIGDAGVGTAHADSACADAKIIAHMKEIFGEHIALCVCAKGQAENHHHCLGEERFIQNPHFKISQLYRVQI